MLEEKLLFNSNQVMEEAQRISPNISQVTEEQQTPKAVAPTPEQIFAIKAAMVNSQTLEEVARLEKALKSGQLPADLNLNDNIMLDTVHEKDEDVVPDGKGQPDGESGDTQELRNTDSAPMEQDHSRLVMEMVTPCANSRLKRKRIAKRTHTQAREGEKEDLHVNEIGKSNDGVVAMLHSPLDHNVRPCAIFILENASLKKGLVKKEWKILNSHDDANYLLKQNKNLNDYRPDIVFEALRTIIDSPLNKHGLVGAIFVRIDGGALFEIKPHVRIPRTCKRFCGLIVELLQKSLVRAKDTNETLLRIVDEPVTRHLPAQSRIIGTSFSSQKLVDIDDYVSVLSDDVTPVFVVGAMVNGKVKSDHAHDYISVSEYQLGAKCCVGLICDALEQKWKLF